ncbi:MAG: STAS domain-containing protein [Sedimentisphaerales bacterium]|nr:STAS domain-containing protein [Sedimentisphaerales bacterium]
MEIRHLPENVLFVYLEEPQLRNELIAVNEILSDGCAYDVIIDFSGIELLTSEGISSMIILERLLKGYGRKIILCAVSANNRQVLERTGIEPLFEFYKDESEALGFLQSSSMF